MASQQQAINQFDCILLDEAQDYTLEEIEVIRTFGKLMFAVGDDNQRIYESSGALTALQSFIPSVKHLPYHYRNGIKICRVADGIRNLIDHSDGLEASSNYDESKFPSTVIDRPNLSVAEQVAAAVPDIVTQLRAYPDGMVGVLCPRHAELDTVWAEIRMSPLADSAQLQRYADGYSKLDPERRVVVTTTHGAKGLEFRAVHLLGMDKVVRFRNKQRNLAYTAVTRAKTSLTIYHEDSLPGYLERGIAAAAGPVPKPPLGSLFKPPRGS